MKFALKFGLLGLLLSTSLLADNARLARGQAVFDQAGCASCHSATEGLPLAGGVELESPFGYFVSTNISPDPQHGLGDWSEADFFRAMKEGVSPQGKHYYPVFPYEFYQRIPDADLSDLWYYLQQQASVAQANSKHRLRFPYNQRWTLGFWKRRHALKQQAPDLSGQSAQWQRGEYLVNGPGHCAACHAPRGSMGQLLTPLQLSGTDDNGMGEAVPSLITSQMQQPWSAEDLEFILQIGMLPDGDFVGGHMGLVVDNTTGRLSAADLKAMVVYLMGL